MSCYDKYNEGNSVIRGNWGIKCRYRGIRGPLGLLSWKLVNFISGSSAPVQGRQAGREGKQEAGREGGRDRGREAINLFLLSYYLGRNPVGRAAEKNKLYWKPLSITDPSEVSSEALAPIL